MQLDAHCHLLPGATREWLRAWPHVQMGPQSIASDSGAALPLPPALDQLDACMERLGPGGHAIVSPPPGLYQYGLDPTQAAEYCERLNDDLLAFTAAETRLAVLGWLPLQSPQLALAETERLAQDPAVVGVVIGSTLPRQRLAGPELDELWPTLAAHRLGVFIHASASLIPEHVCLPRSGPVIGFPIDVSVAAIDLLMSESRLWDEDVPICLSHGGGFLAPALSRINRSLDDDQAARLAGRLRQVWVDGVLFDDPLLTLVSRVFGSDRILPGSDWPFSLSLSREEVERTTATLGGDVLHAAAAVFPRTAARWNSTATT